MAYIELGSVQAQGLSLSTSLYLELYGTEQNVKLPWTGRGCLMVPLPTLIERDREYRDHTLDRQPQAKLNSAGT